MARQLDRLNALSAPAAEAELLRCCGARSWARRMVELRPFRDPAALLTGADAVWWALTADDWLEAFRSHPRIGERAAVYSGPDDWSAQEQSRVHQARDATLAALAQANREYEQRFGRTFIVCATGKSAPEILELLRERMALDQAAECRRAAEEQCRITRLRLERLLDA